jgi:NTE family protein
MEPDASVQTSPADLVLEGGGVKGIGLVGAIGVLEAKGYSFRRVAGTSAGAIVGSMVAAGCSAERLEQIMQTIDYRKFRDATLLSRLGAPGKFASLLIENGLYRGDYLHQWITEQLASCGVKTFGDLRLTGPEAEKLPENQRYKFVVVTADLSKGQMVYLPWDYAKYGLSPDEQPVADAIRASMSIPFFYKPAHIGKSTLVDGGMLSNFPINIFDNSPDWPTFGVKLSAKETALQISRSVTGPLSLATALFATLTNGHDQRHLDNPCTQKRTVFVDTAKIQSIDFDITKEQQSFLFKNGQKAATRFLETWDFEDYKKTCP